MPARNATIRLVRVDELDVRMRATAARLERFRGEMCDVDFDQLVADVLRISEKNEGRIT